MVNISIVPTSKESDSSDMQRIKLEPAQASVAPFPPGCSVAVLDQTCSRISCSGKVSAVYVTFARNTGSCDNCYEVSYIDPKGCRAKIIVNGNLLRYGLNCPIYITTPEDETRSVSNEMIDGFIKGFELKSEDNNTHGSSGGQLSEFLYTVEVSASISDSVESLFRQRGIGHENIRFRPNKTQSMLPIGTKPVFQLPESSSVISLDETSANSSIGKEDNQVVERVESACPPTRHPSLSSSNLAMTPLSPRNLAVTPFSKVPSFQVQPEKLKQFYHLRCTPLPCPVPNKFQGDMAANKDQLVPDFTFLVNFPTTTKSSYPPCRKCCVMCGMLRWVGAKKGQAVPDDAVFIPCQNKGLCTLCDVSVWVVNDTKMQIKWCKGCKNFQTWAGFGDKGFATKCLRCRNKQKEKYAKAKTLSCGGKRAHDGEISESIKRVCERF